MILFLKFLRSIAFPLILLSGCGGGGGGGGDGGDVEGPPNTTAVVSAPRSMSARLLADNTVRLKLSGTGTPARPVCIRQDAATPSATDACFTNTQALELEQTQTIANPSTTQRAVFTAWLLKADNTVSRHAVLSVPGRTCSGAAYAFLAEKQTQQPAVCVLTGADTDGVTNLYESVLLLESVKAPISVGNFLRYVNEGFYDQTVFHRFIQDKVVQGGGFDGAYNPKTPSQGAIPLEPTTETSLSNLRGTIAMARTNVVNSASAGFFVNTADNTNYDSRNLSNNYAVFGRFIYGLDTWDSLMKAVPSAKFDPFGEALEPNPTVRLHWAYQIQ
jgi:peptidyl-prolyl cis-trans isomerase A (cyclophilin A)